jgi:hypothetical protein
VTPDEAIAALKEAGADSVNLDWLYADDPDARAVMVQRGDARAACKLGSGGLPIAVNSLAWWLGDQKARK